MMGVFRLVQGGKAGFYELMTFKEESGSLVFRLKHFNADLTGWEEKGETVDFQLVAIEEYVAFFDGITFIHRCRQGITGQYVFKLNSHLTIISLFINTAICVEKVILSILLSADLPIRPVPIQDV